MDDEWIDVDVEKRNHVHSENIFWLWIDVFYLFKIVIQWSLETAYECCFSLKKCVKNLWNQWKVVNTIENNKFSGAKKVSMKIN